MAGHSGESARYLVLVIFGVGLIVGVTPRDRALSPLGNVSCRAGALDLGGVCDHVGPQGCHNCDRVRELRGGEVMFGGELFVAWSPVAR